MVGLAGMGWKADTAHLTAKFANALDRFTYVMMLSSSAPMVSLADNRRHFMANTTIESNGSGRRANVLRFALTGALAAGIFYVICWLGAFLPIGPATHMYLTLFTSAEISSSLALVQGLCWSLAFGLIAGALIAFIYNLLAPLDRD